MKKLWKTVNQKMITINANSSLLIIFKNHQYQPQKNPGQTGISNFIFKLTLPQQEPRSDPNPW